MIIGAGCGLSLVLQMACFVTEILMPLTVMSYDFIDTDISMMKGHEQAGVVRELRKIAPWINSSRPWSRMRLCTSSRWPVSLS